MNVCFETFGCRLNRAEALEEEARAAAAGHCVVPSRDAADMIVVRCCSVTARAQKECEGLVAGLVRKYPGKRIVKTGCIAGARPSAFAEGGGWTVPDRTSRAYLKVQDGCSGRCSFCIVPQLRGASRSLPRQDALDRARRFADAGYREIVVTGCSLCQYLSGGERLPDLVAALAAAVPECRLRIGSLEPGAVAMETLHAMAEAKNVCRHVHMSAQSGSQRILLAMRRPYAVKDVDEMALAAVRLMPMAGLGCDLIAGFPGESEMDFRLTKSLLRRHPFSNAHVFPYSERPGTPAAGLVGSVAPGLRKERAHILAEIADKNRRNFARRFIGRTVEIVVESSDAVEGWTSEYMWLRESRCATKPQRRASRRRERVAMLVRSAHGGTLGGEIA